MILYINSFFVGQAGHDEPVEHSVAEIAAVELPAELAEVVLDVAGTDVMVDIEEKTLGVADGDVDPGKDLADLLLRDNLGTMAGHDGLEVCV